MGGAAGGYPGGPAMGAMRNYRGGGMRRPQGYGAMGASPGLVQPGAPGTGMQQQQEPIPKEPTAVIFAAPKYDNSLSTSHSGGKMMTRDFNTTHGAGPEFQSTDKFDLGCSNWRQNSLRPAYGQQGLRRTGPGMSPGMRPGAGYPGMGNSSPGLVGPGMTPQAMPGAAPDAPEPTLHYFPGGPF